MITLLTFIVVALILGGVGYYAYRRIAKVWNAEKERVAAAEASLLASLNTPVPREPTPREPSVPSNKTTAQASVPAMLSPDLAPDVGGPRPPVAPPQPAGIVAEMRSFFGDPPPVTPAPPLDERTPPPTREQRLQESVSRLAAALREAADRSEALSAEPGDEAERAARVVAAVTEAVGRLPLGEVAAAALPVLDSMDAAP